MNPRLSTKILRPDFQGEFTASILAAAASPDLISFAGGLPNPVSFPVEAMDKATHKVLEKNGVPTHYLQELSQRETLVKRVSIVPLEVIIRNIAAGSFSKTKAGGNQRLLIEGFPQEASYPFRRTVGGEKILLDSRCQPHRRQGGGTGNDAVQHGSEAAGRGPYIKAAQRRNVQSADLG